MDDVRAGRVLRALRRRLGWTQRQLAERCGLTQQHVSLIERGHVAEATYSIFGERGSIDLVGWDARTSTVLVVEVKTELTTIEATLRKHDEKARLAPQIVRDQLAWQPKGVARLLVLLDDRSSRRRVERAAAVLDRRYPLRGWLLRQWLRRPAGGGDGLLFLSATTGRRTSQRPDGSRGERRDP